MSEGANVTIGSGGFSMPMPAPLPPPPPPKNRRKWLAAILVFFVFIAGMMVGSGLTIAVAVHRLQIAFRHPEEVPARLTTFLDKRLHFSREQAIEVQRLIAKRQSRLQEIRRQVQPQIQSELDALRQEISDVLTPSQQAKWDRLYSEAVRTWLPAAATQSSGNTTR
ncbi:MAG TPA: hypothetical protein VM008_00580 [Phycisphaerae bacterium]|nr:hypothetical protein [Phycisphaerae bacterium]